ncbi:UNVERIFIED_CONTAM: hypothetical protein PYX00_000661 [Menopon gallinae]|uniref:Peptidase M12B domain-containing protein n=1 Tax=Menopon gallinae TaxID=328185 RepID=A0AAW2IAS5_9NEOP
MLPVLITTFVLGCAFATGWFADLPQEYGIYTNDIFNADEVRDYEIIYLNGRNEATTPVLYELTAFGKKINLRLRQNNHLTAPDFSVAVTDGNSTRVLSGSGYDNCYYLHRDEETTAAVNLCQSHQMEGLVFLPNETLEIFPFRSPALKFHAGERLPHIIRKANHKLNPFTDDGINLNLNYDSDIYRKKRETRKNARMTIEAALFLDEPAYRIFAPFFDYNDEKLRDMLLAYINGVQALFHHPSLGKSIDIVLVKIEIFKKQPSDLPHFEGERNQLLDSFCLYNEKHNPRGDENPRHWDMGLYVSGLNFFASENGRRSDATMGLATVNGVCTEKYNCIIAEFGTTNVFGKPYPSAGFTSVYILAHEMGHNIGMHHDSTGNNCPKEGYIMSPSRGTNGETVWSSCSANVVSTMTSTKCLDDSPHSPVKNFDHMKYDNNPGQIWRAKKQCELLIRDHDAELFNPDRLEDICENLQCKTPHRSGFYFAGPALQGTDCGTNKWCQGGKCVRKEEKAVKVVKGGWSNWTPVGECSSGCIKKSRGYQPRRRTCTEPKPVNTDEGCEGPSYDVQICKDDKICSKKKRKTVTEYATEKCREFSKILPDLDPKANGLQAMHESARLWMACAVFCKRKDADMYYTPRIELNDLGTDPYFPDGTWCHNDGLTNYYCLQHHCLPENFKYVKGSFQEDVAFSQNAAPKTTKPSNELLHYLGLDLNGKPLLTTLMPSQANPTFEDDWTDKDYLEVGDHLG